MSTNTDPNSNSNSDSNSSSNSNGSSTGNTQRNSDDINNIIRHTVHLRNNGGNNTVGGGPSIRWRFARYAPPSANNTNSNSNTNINSSGNGNGNGNGSGNSAGGRNGGTTSNNNHSNSSSNGQGQGQGPDLNPHREPRAGIQINLQHFNQQPQQQQQQQQQQLQQEQQLRRINILIPQPQPLPRQLNVHINDLTEQPFIPQPSSTEQEQQEPFPSTSSSSSSSSSSSQPKIVTSFPQEFNCAICFEIMTRPASCGSCDARFCYACLAKQLTTDNTNPNPNQSNNQGGGNNNNNNNNSSTNETKKCPCCRKILFTPPSNSNPTNIYSHLDRIITIDEKLQYKINQWGQYEVKHCMYKDYGCTTLCRPSDITQHEQNCSFRQFRCKYSACGPGGTGGCKFQGTMKELKEHYDCNNYNFNGASGPGERGAGAGTCAGSTAAVTGCLYSKLDPFIKEQRIQSIQFKHMYNIVQTKFIQERALLIGTTNQIMTLQCKNLFNVMDIVECVYLCVCHPIHFVYKGMLYKPFWNCASTRCVVNNYLMLLPSTLWVVKTWISGMDSAWKFVHHLDIWFYSDFDADSDADSDPNSESKIIMEQFELHLLNFVLSFCTALLCFTFLSCFIVDGKSPKQWSEVPVKFDLWGTRWRVNTVAPILQYLQIIQSIFFHFMCIDLENARLNGRFNLRGGIKAFIVLSTIFFPPVVDSILMLTANAHRQQPQTQITDDPKEFRKTLVTGRGGIVTHVGLKYAIMITYWGIPHTVFGLYVYSKFVEYNLFRVVRLPFLEALNDTMLREVIYKSELGSKRNIMPRILALTIQMRMIWLLNLGAKMFPSTDRFFLLVWEKDIVPTVKSFSTLLILQVFFELFHRIGAKIGLTMSKQLTQKQTNNFFRLFVGAVSFVVWLSLLTSIVILM